MVEMKIYQCDRCFKKFSKESDESPSRVVRHDTDYIPEETDGGEILDLCESCMVQFWNWTIHDEDFDKFAESKQKAWDKAAEEKP